MVLTSFCGFHTRWTVPALASDTIGPDYSLLMEGDYVISPYDELIRHISEEEGHDWRLISAMAYHESRFRSHLVSPRRPLYSGQEGGRMSGTRKGGCLRSSVAPVCPRSC